MTSQQDVELKDMAERCLTCSQRFSFESKKDLICLVLYLIPSSLAEELVARVHAKNGADSEVGVDNGASVQRVKGHGESLACRQEALGSIKMQFQDT